MQISKLPPSLKQYPDAFVHATEPEVDHRARCSVEFKHHVYSVKSSRLLAQVVQLN